MAFRRKAAAILAERPDVLIVPECEHPDKLQFDNSVPTPVSKELVFSQEHLFRQQPRSCFSKHREVNDYGPRPTPLFTAGLQTKSKPCRAAGKPVGSKRTRVAREARRGAATG